MGRTILITGASGFLGSALCADLSRDHRVIGLFRRPPNLTLQKAALGVTWTRGDIADPGCLDRIFQQHANLGHPVDYLIHFAAFTGFSHKWADEYNTTNIIGTRNIISSAINAGVKRLLFAGSIAALDPPSPGSILTEKTPAGGQVAYARSKAIGEDLVCRASDRLPGIVLRLGGVFTDWCELPPLFSVIRLWRRPVFGRVIPGKGESAFPYIHRTDVAGIVRRIIEKDQSIKPFDVFFGAWDGATSQRELFPLIRTQIHPRCSTRPIHVPPGLARVLLHGQYWLNCLKKQNTYERAWMMDYVDRPLVVDTAYTFRVLNWAPLPGRHILARLPRILANFNADSRAWTIRNIKRNDQKYEFSPDS